MSDTKLRWILRGLICLLACAFLFPGFDSIPELIFDEAHYVPAARDLLRLSSNPNQEHPLFAKEMIAAGIHLFGDTPVGWRLPGLIVSVFGVLACFEIGLRVFRSLPLGALSAILVLLNMFFVIQARTAMLDTFAYPLFAISVALLIWSAEARSRIAAMSLLMSAGAMLGLATGSKWTVGIYAVLVLIFLIGRRLVTTMASRQHLTGAMFGKGYKNWPNLSLMTAGLFFGLPALLTYAATFLPAYFLERDAITGIFGIFSFHEHMLSLQTAPLAENSYESDWWSWPILLEPIWYYFSETPNGNHRAIFYLGNPVIIWGGLLASFACLSSAFRGQPGVPFYIAVAFLGSWLIFAILPKQIGFLFYFHGSAMILCFAWPAAITLLPEGRLRIYAMSGLLAACTAVFLFFLPVVYALDMPKTQWLRYIWLPTWT